MTARFRRRAGGVSVRFTAEEAGLLRQLVGEVVELLGGPDAGTDDPLDLLGAGTDDPLGGPSAGTDDLPGGLGRPGRPAPTDPVLTRLLPDGYRDDPEAAGELRRLTEPSLRAEKVRNAQAVLDALPARGGSLTLAGDEAALAWLRALNDVRLALGTRLEVTEEMDLAAEVAADPDSERSYALIVYDWLGWLQETLIRSVSADG